MGDSRVRQQFYNFVVLIPDYDQIRQPIQNSRSFHDEMEITSNILKLRLSFKWRPLIDDNVTDTVRRWASSDSSERPHLLFLSIVVHHMLGTNGADHRLYEENFKKFAPELGRLANVSQVIWFNQYPVEELPEKIHDHNTYIHSEKIDNYNKAIRRLLESESSRIRIWDSSDPLAEEYIRSCAVLKRDEIVQVDRRSYLFKDAAFADCNDFIHTGYSALSQATNLLYNDICNDVMELH
ncbi:N-acetylneuraminate 9-O-acetyltransferase-like [Daphnia carinata]|uniref:N-acetylneuraminate 9-O-acetyltransferase-like n=1 Tax=Daphnia carinata TaxID=120202 RepID=UPI00257A1848|nr:N-acetylneuraminate 9-O-acetyltransferase-like [Daphnia carinata]